MESLELRRLFALKEKILERKTFQEKLSALKEDLHVQAFFAGGSFSLEEVCGENLHEAYLCLSLVAAGQEHLLKEGFRRPFWESWMASFAEIDQFYQEEGGIIGYQYRVALIQQPGHAAKEESIAPPPVIDISEESSFVKEHVVEGIFALDKVCLLLPVGGAADRLHLVDEVTGEPLPAGCLHFFGATLLEKLFFDVEGLEYLHYKLFHKTVRVPIVLMSSQEKNNHNHIATILQKRSFFSRSTKEIRIIVQPSVPVVDEKGRWCLKNRGSLLLKPSGHGALWKQMKDSGVFSWLSQLGVTKALVRQINNPVSAYDYPLSAFLGYGAKNDAAFGVISCRRKEGAKEGMNVVKKRLIDTIAYLHLSNIEYCDFQRIRAHSSKNVEDSCARYPANTNILFVDLPSAEKAVEEEPFPGLLLNGKETEIYEKGAFSKKKVARLESTMQNISDQIVEPGSSLKRSFVFYHEDRYKTMSTAKKALQKARTFLETPERCFYDCLQNLQALLDSCGIQHVPLLPFPLFLEQPPPFLVEYHPALGPVFSVIQQKMRLGAMQRGASLRLEIAELLWHRVRVDGDLDIRAENITGHQKNGEFLYSHETGKCILENVSIQNRGRRLPLAKQAWTNGRKEEKSSGESLSIVLEGNGEFVAKGVFLEGNLCYRVEKNRRLTLVEDNGKIVERWERLREHSWHWEYELGENHAIRIEQKKKKQQHKATASLKT